MDVQLRSELLHMQEEDLAVRRELIDLGELDQGYHPRIAAVHRKNSARMSEILEQYGWPGRGLAGEDGCEAAWKIVQHAILDPALQRRGLEFLRSAVAAGEAPAWQMAMLTDRVLMQEGKPQWYGSILVAGEHGLTPWDIAEPQAVDARRYDVGLPPLREHMQRLQAKAEFEERVQRAARASISLPAALLATYAGQYQLDDGATITITYDRGQVSGHMAGIPPVAFVPESESEFLVREAYARITFVKEPTGQITHLILHLDGRESRAEKMQ
jgi:hypothetical protein